MLSHICCITIICTYYICTGCPIILARLAVFLLNCFAIHLMLYNKTYIRHYDDISMIWQILPSLRSQLSAENNFILYYTAILV